MNILDYFDKEMSLNCNDLNISEEIFLVGNKSENLTDLIYKSNDKDLLKRFSSLIINLSFSSNDLEYLLENSSINSLKSSPKLFSSLMMYSTSIIILFILFSILFYLLSYSNHHHRFKSSKHFSLKLILILFLIIIYLFIFIQMIYLLQNLYKIKINLNKSIKQINSQLNLKNLLQYFLKQFDQFFSKSNSMILNGSKLLMRKSFSDYYYLDEINRLINNINQYLKNFNSFIVKNEILNEFVNQLTNSWKYLTNFNEKFCDFIKRNEIDNKIFSLINNIQQQIKYSIQIIDKEYLNQKIFNQKQETIIQSSISFITILTLIICLILSTILFLFVILIITKYFYFYSNHRIRNYKFQQRQNYRLHSLDVQQLSHHPHRHQFRDISNGSLKKHRSRKILNSRIQRNDQSSHSLPINNHHIENQFKDQKWICSIRIIFGFLSFLLILLCIISTLFYILDMLTQSSCRLIHSNQPFLISLLTENFLKSIDDFHVNTTIYNLINDCQNKIHFSEKFFEQFSSELTNELSPIIKQLNENIYNQFQMIYIPTEFHLLNNFVDINNLPPDLNLIENDFNQLNNIFKQIKEENSQLPMKFLNRTLNEFKFFLKTVIQSTIDSCPLPIDDFLHIDQLICHETADLINGLWLKILLFIFNIQFTFSIFALYIYKRLD